MLQRCLKTFSKTCFKQKKSPDLSETCFRLVCNLSVTCRKCRKLFYAQLNSDVIARADNAYEIILIREKVLSLKEADG